MSNSHANIAVDTSRVRAHNRRLDKKKEDMEGEEGT